MAGSQFTAAHDSLVEAVVAMRKAAGLTQRQLAKAVGREHNYVARVETRQRRIDLIELIRLCEACGRDPRREIAAMVATVSSLSTKRSAR
jgi:transcriptional regulator with XRE-family HTH domain